MKTLRDDRRLYCGRCGGNLKRFVISFRVSTSEEAIYFMGNCKECGELNEYPAFVKIILNQKFFNDLGIKLGGNKDETKRNTWQRPRR